MSAFTNQKDVSDKDMKLLSVLFPSEISWSKLHFTSLTKGSNILATSKWSNLVSLGLRMSLFYFRYFFDSMRYIKFLLFLGQKLFYLFQKKLHKDFHKFVWNFMIFSGKLWILAVATMLSINYYYKEYFFPTFIYYF